MGLFRRSGVRSRIQQLRLACEEAGEEGSVSFDGFTAYDVADLVKQYLRELPEVLLTSRVSQMLITIYQCKLGVGHNRWLRTDSGVTRIGHHQV